MNYPETIQYLYSLQKFGIKLGLSSTENLLDRLGRPQDRLACLHIAGTNGKGSVGATLISIFSQAGFKVGFYSSPHLVTFRERFQIGQGDRQEMLSEDDVVRLVQTVLPAVAEAEPPTFFEFVTAMAFVHFVNEKVDLAIMETGLGGRLDATNIVRPLAAVITNISLEHQEYLGSTLMAIASEKAGIIKPGLDVVTGESRPRIRAFFETRTRDLGGRLWALGRDFKVRTRPGGGFDYRGDDLRLTDLHTPLAGPHQVRNAGLALAALEILGKKGFPTRPEHIREGLARVVWPGRAEVFPGPPRIMLDGAHNPAAARVLARMLESWDRGRMRLVLGIMADKDIDGVIGPLMPLAHEIHLTRPAYSRAAEPQVLAERVRGFKGPIRLWPTIAQALEGAKTSAGPDDLIVVTGSLFTVGEARSILTGVPLDGLTG
jgi:dihydrofolate synthase/folylpolyglutamate synthase